MKKNKKATKYMYELLSNISLALNLCPFADAIIKIIKGYGGYDIIVHPRGYSFKTPENVDFTNGEKRKMGREIAKISGIGCYAYKREYFYSNGTPAKSAQLFKRSKKIEF